MDKAETTAAVFAATHTHLPAGSQHAALTHLIVLADELEDRDLVVFGELVFG